MDTNNVSSRHSQHCLLRCVHFGQHEISDTICECELPLYYKFNNVSIYIENINMHSVAYTGTLILVNVTFVVFGWFLLMFLSQSFMFSLINDYVSWISANLASVRNFESNCIWMYVKFAVIKTGFVCVLRTDPLRTAYIL